MRFPIGCPVPVGVWRETPPPPDSLSSPKRKGRERRQGRPHATHLGPLATAFLPFAVFLTNVRAVGPPPHCRLFSSHAFTLLNFPFLNLVYSQLIVRYQSSEIRGCCGDSSAPSRRKRGVPVMMTRFFSVRCFCNSRRREIATVLFSFNNVAPSTPNCRVGGLLGNSPR